MWKFDPLTLNLIFQAESISTGSNVEFVSLIDFGFRESSDLSVEMGQRKNETTIIDSGTRTLDGNI